MSRSRYPSLRNHYFNLNNNIWYTEDGLVVTTLYLPSLGKKVRHHHLFNHFSAFGAVKNVKIYNKPTYSFGYTTFTEAKSATKALANLFHRIAGQTTRVAIADSRHQDKPLEHSGFATHILDLNDECIFEIFSTKLIDISDLCAVARTCTRLKDITNRIFTRNYEVCILRTIVDNFLDARRILVTFGSIITELWIGGSLRNQVIANDINSINNELWQFILDLTIRCCNDRLKTLRLTYIVISDVLAPKLKPLFNKLRKLQFFFCKIDHVTKDILAGCSSLVDFFYFGTDVNLRCIIENIFPELETFQYAVPLTIRDAPDWDIFSSRHNFKRLAITTFDYYSLFANCKNLEELVYMYVKVSNMEEAINGILCLDHLKKLKICSRGNFTKLIPKLDVLKSLQCLEFQNIIADSKFTKVLSQLKRIQILRLRHCKGLENLHLLGDMNQLTELLVYPTENVDLDIVSLIKNINNLKTLHLNSKLFEMNEKIYLRILDAILWRDVRSRQMLEITYYSPIEVISTAADLVLLGGSTMNPKRWLEISFSPIDAIFNLQCVKVNSHIVKLRRLHNYDPVNDMFHCKL